MTVITTENWGFVGVYNAVPSTNDWACTYWNWISLDSILYGLVQHTHDGAAAIANPTGTLLLSTSNSGGYLASDTTYYFVVTYIDSLGRETAASSVVSETTGEGISTPDTPTIDDDATPTDIQPAVDGLVGGEYWYKISYKKGTGETLPSLPVYVHIPNDDKYECTIHFYSLATVDNGADTIVVYRKIGTSGSYVKLAEITNTATNYYTDDNTGIPTCDVRPRTVSTINNAHSITIDWSDLDYTIADKVRIYATTTNGTYPTNSLITEVEMDSATPVESYTWTGVARTTGKPPEISQCYPSANKINLASEVQGNLPWENLPSDFTWGEPVQDLTALGLIAGIDGEARVVLDEDSIYIWDDDTSEWVEISGGGIETISIPYEEIYDSNTLESYLPTENLTDNQVVIINQKGNAGDEDYNYRIAIFQYHEEWSTPGWVKLGLMPVLPYSEFYGNYWWPFDEINDRGLISMCETSWGSYIMITPGIDYGYEEHPLVQVEHELYFGLVLHSESRTPISTHLSVKEYFDPTTPGSEYYDECNEFLTPNTYAFSFVDRLLSQWNSIEETWEIHPTFKFRGIGESVPSIPYEDDIFIENSVTKKAVLSDTSRNLMLSEENAGLFRETPSVVGWEPIKDPIATWEPTIEASHSSSRLSNIGSSYKVYLYSYDGNSVALTSDYAIPITPETDYTFSFYLYGQGISGTERIQFVWLDAGKNVVSTTNSSTWSMPTTGIERIERTATSPSGAAYCKIRIANAENMSMSTAQYISQMQFEEGSSATDWVSPEYDWEECGFDKFKGVYDTPSDLPTSANGNDIAFVKTDGESTPTEINSWYLWDEDLATPTWVQIGLKQTGQTINDMNSATPSAEENKINEILVALRESGVINT